MTEILLSIILCAVVLSLLLIYFFRPKTQTDGAIQELETYLREEFKSNREETQRQAKENREELAKSILNFQHQFLTLLQTQNEQQKNSLDYFQKMLNESFEKLTVKLEEKLTVTANKSEQADKDNREELRKSLKDFSDQFEKNVKEFNELLRQKFNDLQLKQDELVKTTELKLEKMRETVDEKLHKTLEERLGQSFKVVTDQLQAVSKGLGEMQSMVSDVGDLKRVLQNVKSKGVLGEYQLGNLLEQVLSPEQYDKNVKTKKGSSDHVEYAIKLPGKDDLNSSVYLPIDAKFPLQDYTNLQNAYDAGNLEQIDSAGKSLENSIKKFAKDIKEKYIDVPYTTDFAIMFLPVEGLYAEVVRRPILFEYLQREMKVTVTGPTTLAAFLNSLQMGFKTLAIQKRSSEVWVILNEVKTEFGKFGDTLSKVQSKIADAGKEIDNLITTRTNKLNVKLKKVHELPASEIPIPVLPPTSDSDETDVLT